MQLISVCLFFQVACFRHLRHENSKGKLTTQNCKDKREMINITCSKTLKHFCLYFHCTSFVCPLQII